MINNQQQTQYQRENSKYTSMSKLIGFGVFGIVAVVILFSMYEMHRIQDISSLQYLIGGVLAILASYIGFYINMAKAEHIEDKKNEIKRELELMRQDGSITKEEWIRIQELKKQLEEMSINLEELNTEEEIKYE